jgi:hypothetical protein
MTAPGRWEPAAILIPRFAVSGVVASGGTLDVCTDAVAISTFGIRFSPVESLTARTFPDNPTTNRTLITKAKDLVFIVPSIPFVIIRFVMLASFLGKH